MGLLKDYTHYGTNESVNHLRATYAAYSKVEDERLSSSSGGLFSLLAKRVLELNGVVYGVRMSEDCRRAEYDRITSIHGMSVLRGSKYLQARMGDTYQQVKNDLDGGSQVLFSGVGCQINGLKLFLGKEYDNLFCIDVICHGVPSSFVWDRYIDYCENKYGGKIQTVNFRCKDDGWQDFGMKKIGDAIEIFSRVDIDPYMLMFLRNYSLRPSCYNCTAKQIKMADITLGDFWGINNIDASINDDKGISLVIVRTNKGNEYLNSIKSKIILKNVEYHEAVKQNSAEYKSVDKPKARETFFDDLIAMSFEDICKKYATPKKATAKDKMKKIVRKYIKYSKKLRMGGVKRG